MPKTLTVHAAERLPPPWRADFSKLTAIVRCLVGHTVDEVERELILASLDHHCGNRTYTANVLGISIRCLRNKINRYARLGVPVPAPGQPENKYPGQTH